ncbi:TnpV protein [Ligilactobacillus ruminis]|uniref:TnpV protein n=1 Tax=Ligilactobacillus ruminis TaxID=1623 RepID=UPI0035626046
MPQTFERKPSHYLLQLFDGTLNKHLKEIDIRAEKMFQQLVKSLAEKENVTESLKAKDMMLWVQKMNNTRNRATEIVNTEVIFV